MLRSSIIISGLLALFATISMAQKRSEYVSDELLVRFRKDASTEQIKSAHQKNHAAVIESLGDLGWQRIRLPASLTVPNAIAEYQASGLIEHAQPNFYYSLLATPNDPDFSDPAMYGLQKISAPQAWDLTTGNPAVIVANIDTGIRYTHEDLAANMRRSEDVRRVQAEAASWITLWLQSPELFENWVKLRQSSEEFKRTFTEN